MTEHIITIGDKTVRATRKQIQTLAVLSTLRAGGIASVKGYVPSTGYTVSPVVNITFLSRFSVERLYERKIRALKGLTFADVSPNMKGEKLTSLTVEEQETQFRVCVDKMIESMETTLGGVREDAHRIAHDTFYATDANGIKVHLETEKVGKETRLVLTDGRPTVKSIMVGMIELSRTVVKEGEYKVVNSGVKVLMDNAIDRTLNGRSVGYKTLSLKEDNFETLTMDRERFTPEDIMERVRGTVTVEDLTAILETEEDVIPGLY